MPTPTFDESQIYKHPALTSEVKVAVELDYPVFGGNFLDDFAGAALDTLKWFEFKPSWGVVTVAGGTVTIGANAAAIAPAWLQSKHGQAFPLSRDTDWQFDIRCRFPVVHGYGVFVRLCGASFRDAEAVWAIKCNSTDGMSVHCPDGFSVDTTIWSTAGPGDAWRRYRVAYSAQNQTYITYIDENDDGVYEIVRVSAVGGRYVDCIVLGNSVAIQGALGDWTQLEVDQIEVAGIAEATEDPFWAAPFVEDGVRYGFLRQVLDGRVAADKDNVVDAASITLDNFDLGDTGEERGRLYTDVQFINRKAIVVARALADGAATPWLPIFYGVCAEKQIEYSAGRGVVTLPLRDVNRAQADDQEVLGCWSDAAAAITGVEMHKTAAQIIQSLLETKAGIAAADLSIVATPHNVPRQYNVFRQSAIQAAKQIADQAALCIYQTWSDGGRIHVTEWPWGTGTPDYRMSTAQEIEQISWTVSSFDFIAVRQLNFEQTQEPTDNFSAYWPPHKEPWYGKISHDNAIVCQTGAQHDARPLTALQWWAANRKYGSLTVMAPAQLWVEHDMELEISDTHYLGVGKETTYIVDGWEHTWDDKGHISTSIRMIDRTFWRMIRRSLREV